MNRYVNPCILGLLFLSMASAKALHAGLPAQAIILSGQAAPGAPGRFFSTGLRSPSVNSAGRVVFGAWMSGLTSNDEGIWTGLPGGLQLAAREGAAAPGAGAGVLFAGSFGFPVINASGQLAFKANLSGAGVNATNGTGVWTGAAGGLVMAARAGNQAPGLPAGVNFGISFTEPFLNDAGQISFRAKLVGTGIDASNDWGIFAGAPGALQFVARESDPAPGTGGAFFNLFVDQFIINTLPVLNSAGQVVFHAYLNGPGVDGSNDVGIWRWTSGIGLELVARKGSTAPGTNAYFEFMYDVGLNASGQASFHGGLTGGDVDGTNHVGVWKGGPGDVQLVVRQGSPAPGAAPLKIAPNSGLFGTHPIADDGAVTFVGFTLDESNTIVGEGIWSYESGVGQVVVLEQTAAPGLGGLTFAGVGFWGGNSASGTVFTGNLAGDGVTASNDDSLWVGEAGHDPVLIAREGTPFDVGGGVFRTVQVMTTVFGGGSYYAACYSPARQFAFQINFTDATTGLFITNVPGPTSPADMNCDGAINGDDIQPFVLAMLNSAGYPAAYPSCNILNGDINHSGTTDGADAGELANCVLNGGCP